MTTSFARNALVTSLSQALTLLLGLATSVVVARVLGPEGRGAYALVALLASFLVYFTSLGLGQAAVFYLGRRAYPPQVILGHSVAAAVALSLVAIGVGWLVIQRFGGTLFPGVEIGLLRLALALVPVQLAFGFLSSVLLGLQEIGRYNLVQLLRAGATLVAVLLLLGLGLGVRAAVGADGLAFGIGALVLLALTRYHADGLALRPNWAYVRKSLRYGLSVFSGSSLVFVHYRADVFLLNLLLNPAAVGLYSVSAGLSEKMALVSEGAATVLFPRISSETDPDRLRAFTPRVLRAVLLLAVPAAAVLASLSPWLIVTIFSDAFAPSVRPFQVLLVGAVALCGWSILESDFKGRGRPGWCVATTALAVVLNLALNLAWIPRFGIMGAAWASAVSYSVTLLFAVAVYCRVSGNRLSEVVMLRRADLEVYLTLARGARAALLASRRREAGATGAGADRRSGS